MATTLDPRQQLIRLIESAEKCEQSLNRLKKHASDSKAKHSSAEEKHLLDYLIKRVNRNIASLEAWTAAINKGGQTSDTEIIATIDSVSNALSYLDDATEILNHRLGLSILPRRSKIEDDARLRSVLDKVTEMIGCLYNLVETEMLDSDQERWKPVIAEVVQRRRKSYHVFVKALGQMSVAERRIIRFGSLKLLWQEFPARLDLGENVGNADDPGDGKVYREKDILQVASILKAFWDAWSVATLKANDVNATSPETVRKVGKIPNMAKICLILRGMKQERLLDYFCDKSKDDKHLPLRLDSVKEILEPEDADHAGIFVTEQYRAVCRTWNDGEHINIAEKEPLPLIFRSEYMSGAYTTMRRCRHAFTDVYYDCCKIQVSHETRSHLLREIARLRKLRHRHIVQFVKSYQRGNQYGILLKPAATTNLKGLLNRYRRNGFAYKRVSGDHRRDRVVLKPIILTAFGCLSRGLAHIHGCNIRHRDIKMANILYEKASSPARFLWADFDSAYDFSDQQNSRRTRPSWRYAAPEVTGNLQARMLRTDSDQDESDDDAPEQSGNFQGVTISHGRSSDIYSFGIVFLEILSFLIAEGPEPSVPGDFEACMPSWKNIEGLQEWAEKQIQELDHDSPLRFLFQLSLRMIAHIPEDRPTVTQIVQDLTKAGPQYFCTACHHEPKDLTSQADNTEEQVGGGDDSEHSHSVSSDQDSSQQERSSALHYTISTELQDNADEALPEIEDEGDDDLASLASLQSFPDLGYGSLDDHFELRDEAEEFVSLLLVDVELQKLFAIAFKRTKARERFVIKFRMLLKVFGNELKREAQNPLHEAAAGLAQAKATYVANEIQRWYQLEDEQREKATGRSERVETMLVSRVEPADFPDQYKYANDSDSSNDAESATEDQPGHDQKQHVSLIELKDFMISSQAFTNLQNAFRRMVYPDPLMAISDTISDAYELCPGKRTAVFNVRWELAQYLETELGYHTTLQQREHLLESVLTVSGTASKAYATTAAEYMRWKWPRSNFKLLETIEQLLKGQSAGIGDSIDLSITLHIPDGSGGPTVASISVNGSLKELIEVAQQLAWITASFRIPQYGQVSYSEISFERIGNMVFNIFPLELEAVRQRASACWLPLFVNGVVARGFPIPARNGQKGIEIPFPIMTGLANIMYPVFHAEGVYLRGFSNLVFPTAVSQDINSVQWHLMTSPKHRVRLPLGTLPSEDTEHQWLKFTDFERLASAARTFLGYCRAVDVHLGTESSKENYSAVTYSGADDENPAPGVNPKSVTTGTPGMGIWSFQVNMDIVLPKGLFITTEPGWYLDLVDLAKEAPVIVYDVAQKSKRAWLVSTLSVILHMAHIWARDKDDLLTPLPFASTHWDSGEAAFITIKKHSRDELRDGMEGNKKYCLSDLTGRLLLSLDKLAETEALARSEPGRTVKLESSKIYGWDLLAIAQGKKIIKRKQLEISEDWIILGADILVLFCQHFGDIIKPASDVRICPMGNLARHGQNYLTATVKCLQTLSEERSGSTNSACLRLANQAYWLSPGDDQFEDCTQCLESDHKRHAKCLKRPQKIVAKEPSSHKACKIPPIQGAVSFGKRKLQKMDTSVLQERLQQPLAVSDTQLVNGSQSNDPPLRASDLPEIYVEENSMADEVSLPPRDRPMNSSATSETQDVSEDAGEGTPISSLDPPTNPSTGPETQDLEFAGAKKGRLQVIGTNVKNFTERLKWKKLRKFRRPRSKKIHESDHNQDNVCDASEIDQPVNGSQQEHPPSSARSSRLISGEEPAPAESSFRSTHLSKGKERAHEEPWNEVA